MSSELRLVVIGEALSGLATQVALVAIPCQVYVLTHSAALVGLLGLVELGPARHRVAARRGGPRSTIAIACWEQCRVCLN